MEVELIMLKDTIMDLTKKYQMADIEHKQLIQKDLEDLIYKARGITQTLEQNKDIKQKKGRKR